MRTRSRKLRRKPVRFASELENSIAGNRASDHRKVKEPPVPSPSHHAHDLPVTHNGGTERDIVTFAYPVKAAVRYPTRAKWAGNESDQRDTF